MSTLVAIAFSLSLFGSDVKEVLPLCDRIILVTFDDGTVNYPNDLQVDRLNLTLAVDPGSYLLSSLDDADFTTGKNPAEIGRKSKGTEFIKDPPWGGNSYDPRSKPWASEHYIYLFLDNPLKAGMTYSLNIPGLAKNGTEWSFTFGETSLRSEAVHVNTIGYAADAPKYGYVYQWMGDKGGLDLTPYAGNAFHIYVEGSDTPVYSGVLVKRKSATNAETSHPLDTPNGNFLGAEVYECDFSQVTADGNYTLVVEGVGASYPFKIGADALWEAYYACGRALYHQRSGIRLAPPYTADGYIRPVNQNPMVTSDDGADFTGMLLYSNYSFMDWEEADGGGASQAMIRDSAIGKPLDVAGWYHDAGDWDGYYSHQRIPILLMTTFEYTPERFADGDLNLPESGNGIPDIVDEASWLVKFNYRLRKELMNKGYSDGGVGGARVCADVFTEVDGKAESDVPSWKEYRRTVVTQADAFMTYLYAGQAAQFAVILNKLGKDPHAFPVEMLDHVDLASMTKDVVDWEKEAREAYGWASDPENQPASTNNYGSNALDEYRMYAAANLYRLSNDEAFNDDAISILNGFKTAGSLGEDERWGVYAYLLADNYGADPILKSALENVAINAAKSANTNAIKERACRWGGNFTMPMLVGQGTTPWMFESIVAYGLTGDKFFSDAIHTTVDYFLGSNPMHTTWTSGLGPRPAEAGFHLDSRYNNNWVLYPGFVPYGPWSMEYGYEPYTYTIDGVVMEGGHGPWNKDWANFSQYPAMDQWPGHERWNSNIHAPMSSENTVHQNAVYVGLTYGFVNARHNTNASAAKPIGILTLNKSSLMLMDAGDSDTLVATPDIEDAGFGMLNWSSDDSRIAHVDAMGRVTGVTSGSTTISCSTLDGSVVASCAVTCNWVETAVDSIIIEPDSLRLVEGQSARLEVFFYPDEVTNRFVDWSYSQEGIVVVDELGVLSALVPGSVELYATSLNGGKRDTCYVEVEEAVDYVIADFDLVVPVKTEPKPDSAQIYTPGGGSCDIEAVNPSPNISNPSEKVVLYNKAEGEWMLLGMVLPTEEFQDLSRYSQFQFKYYGKDIEAFFIQITSESGEKIELTVPVESDDAWRLFALDLNSDFSMKQFNLFANPQGKPAEISCYYDDFMLAGKPAEWFSGLTISDHMLDMTSGEEVVLAADAQGNPFSWISTNPAVATVDQDGKVKAISKGDAIIKAIPLYGDAQECTVAVDGGGDPWPEGYQRKVILDFENYELDWTAGYGGYAWSSANFARVANPDQTPENSSDWVVSWDRDDTNFGGGLGIMFPGAETSGWERFSLQAYSDAPVSALRIELYNGDELLAEIQKDVDLPVGVWTQVLIDLADMGASDINFNKIHFQYAIGTKDVMTVFTDNVWLEKGVEKDTTVAVTGISIQGAAELQLAVDETLQLIAVIEPDSATNQSVSWSSDDEAIVSVSESGLLTALAPGISMISATSDAEPGIMASVQVTVNVTPGIAGVEKGSVVLYPNPVSDFMIVRTNDPMERVEVFNVAGERVLDTPAKGLSQLEIKGLNLEAAPYLVRITTAGGVVLYNKIMVIK